MIKLEVEEYCHGCPKFNPVIDYNQMALNGFKAQNTIVACEHRTQCKQIASYLEKNIEVKVIYVKETE